MKGALDAFAPDVNLATIHYRDFVAKKIGSEERLWSKVINGIYLGSAAWARAMRKKVEWKPRSTDHPKAQRAIGRPKMHAVIEAVGKTVGESAGAIRSMRGGKLRRLAAWIGWHEGLLTLRTIAASLRLRSEGARIEPDSLLRDGVLIGPNPARNARRRVGDVARLSGANSLAGLVESAWENCLSIEMTCPGVVSGHPASRSWSKAAKIGNTADPIYTRTGCRPPATCRSTPDSSDISKNEGLTPSM